MGKKKGGKKIRRGKKQNEQLSKRTLEFKEDGQAYAKVLKNLGNCRLEVLMDDENTKLAIIPGRFRKKVWIQVNDVLLVSIRDFQSDKVDVIHKYIQDEVKTLVSYGEISDKWLNNDHQEQDDDDKVDFGIESSNEDFTEDDDEKWKKQLADL